MNPNRDFVAADVDVELRWTLNVPATATTISDQPRELLPLVKAALGCCEPFVRFYACEVVVHTFDNDISYADRYEDKTKSTASTTIESKDPLTFTEVRNAVEELSGDGYPVVSSLEFTDAETFVTLQDFEGYVRRDDGTHYKTVKRHRVQKDHAFDDLVGLRIMDSEAKLTELETPMLYEFQVMSVSEIWAENTDLGKQNRKRMVCLLTCLDEQLPDGSRNYWGEPWGEQALYEVDHFRPLVPWIDPG